MFIIKGSKPFALENGQVLNAWTIAYQTFGTLNEAKDNVIWVSHALTANSDVLDWWSGLFGPGKLFDTNKYFVICPNALGSCYGSTGAATTENGEPPLLEKFPTITTRDMARFHDLLRQRLGIAKIKVLIGASLGGQQAMEWAIEQSSVFDRLILLATNAQHSPYGIAFNESQRLAIQADPEFGNGDPAGAKNGLAIARSIAMISYRSYEGYAQTQAESNTEKITDFNAASYQRYQGEKLANRFSAYSYISLSKAMDSHNVGRGRVSKEVALNSIKAKTICIGISSDALFPTSEQLFLSQHITGAIYREIDSLYGHDGFLIETPQLANILSDFLQDKLSANHLGEDLNFKTYQFN